MPHVLRFDVLVSWCTLGRHLSAETLVTPVTHSHTRTLAPVSAVYCVSSPAITGRQAKKQDTGGLCGCAPRNATSCIPSTIRDTCHVLCEGGYPCCILATGRQCCRVASREGLQSDQWRLEDCHGGAGDHDGSGRQVRLGQPRALSSGPAAAAAPMMTPAAAPEPPRYSAPWLSGPHEPPAELEAEPPVELLAPPGVWLAADLGPRTHGGQGSRCGLLLLSLGSHCDTC